MRWVRRIISTEALERVSCKDKKRCAEIGTFENRYKELQLLIMMRSTTRLREQVAETEWRTRSLGGGTKTDTEVTGTEWRAQE